MPVFIRNTDCHLHTVDQVMIDYPQKVCRNNGITHHMTLKDKW